MSEVRMPAAAEEIFALCERTISEYEEELCRSKEENERQRKLLDAVFSPPLRLNRTHIQQQLVSKENPLAEQQEPEPPDIKEEQWSSEDREQLQGLEEADIPKLSFPLYRLHFRNHLCIRAIIRI